MGSYFRKRPCDFQNKTDLANKEPLKKVVSSLGISSSVLGQHS